MHLLTSSSGLKAFAIKLLGRFVLDTGSSLFLYKHEETRWFNACLSQSWASNYFGSFHNYYNIKQRSTK